MPNFSLKRAQTGSADRMNGRFIVIERPLAIVKGAAAPVHYYVWLSSVRDSEDGKCYNFCYNQPIWLKFEQNNIHCVKISAKFIHAIKSYS